MRSLLLLQAKMSEFWFTSAALALLLLVVLNVDAYKNNFGKCAAVESQPNFKMEKMLGNWYVIEATSTSKKCLTYTFMDKIGHPGAYLLTETYAPSGIAQFFGRRSDSNRVGVLNPVDTYDPAVMSYKMAKESVRYKFTVLSTDYDNYALIYACKKISLGLRRWSAMILSRTPLMEPALMTKLWTQLAWYHINIYSMSRIGQEHCRNDVHAKKKTTPSLEKTLNELFTKPTTTTTEVVLTTTSLSAVEKNLDAIFRKPETESKGLKEWVTETTPPQLRGFLDEEDKSAKLRAEEIPRFVAF